MADITLTTGITNNGMFPVDGKNYFLTQTDVSGGIISTDAYGYYERMIINIADDGTQWIWREESTIGETGGLYTTSFEYPSGIISNGIDYGLRTFNFFPYSPGGSSFDQSLNTTDDVIFNSITGDGSGLTNLTIPVYEAGTNITIDSSNLLAPIINATGGGDSPTGLEKITEASNSGWRLIDQDPANFGNIGAGAVDLSSSLSTSSTFGATGFGSFACGTNNISSNSNTFVSGQSNESSGSGSSTMNSFNLSAGTSALSAGQNNFARSFGEFSIGLYGTDTSGEQVGSWVGTDRLFNIGNGQSTGSRSDALTILKNGNTTFVADVDVANLTSTNATLTGELIFSNAHSNIHVGSSSASTTSGLSNSVVGNSALQFATTSASNSILGRNAMRFHNGNYNVAIGEDTLLGGDFDELSNNTGEYNIAIGHKALLDHSSGDGNIAVGFLSQGGSTTTEDNTGSNNTSVGHLSQMNREDATSCVSVGSNSLQVNTSGINNTAIGTNALVSVTGESNTAVGYGAGLSNTTGLNNTLIGNGAIPSVSTVSNEFTLGNSSVTNLRCNDQTISALSDERDKIDIVDCPIGLDYINELRPVEFKWNYREEHYVDGIAPSKNGTKEIGFIAQDLKEVQDKNNADSLKSYHEYGAEVNGEGVHGIDIIEADYGKLLPVIVQAMKELKSKNDELLKRIKDLEYKL